MSQLSIIQLSIMQAEKSSIFPVVTWSELGHFLRSDCFFTGLGLTLDPPRLIKSETLGHVYFWERFPHKCHKSLLRNPHLEGLNKTTLPRIDAQVLPDVPQAFFSFLANLLSLESMSLF